MPQAVQYLEVRKKRRTAPETEEEEPVWRRNTRKVWCPGRTVSIWSSSPGTVQVSVCVSVIAVVSIFHSPNCLYSDDKFCGLPTKKAK